MDNPSIISTKLNPPRTRTDVVIRPRVIEILNEGLTRPSALTLVSAPAGYGKTTLVISWLRSIDQHYAWLSLGVEDDNLTRFIIYLISALQKVNPTIGETASQLIEGFHTDTPQVDAILSSLIQDLAKLSQPVLLVLEDYHFIDSTAIHDFVMRLIEHTQTFLQIIITTRTDPPLPLAKWRARNQLTEIRVTDLQFKFDEATEFLRQVMMLKFSKDEIRLLAERTEGWVAGLQLAALSIRNHQSQSEAWTIESGHRDIADYLMNEVVGQLPKERREFLLQTSMVSRLSASLCNTITERNDSQLILESLEADNLFTIALDDTREWFRYHHLFAEFLYKRLMAEYSENFVNGLHQRAGHWLAEHGFIIEAIDHALAAKDYEYAACLIAPQSEQWMRRGETSTILKYLDQLPKEMIWNQWDLSMWYGWSYAVKGDLDSSEHWTNRLEALITPLIQDATLQENEPIPLGLQNAYVQVLAIRSIVARQNKDFVSALALGEQALHLIPEGNINLYVVVSALHSSATLEAGNFDQAESLLNSARRTAYHVGNPYITFTILLNESALAIMRGKLQSAYDLNSEALQLTQTASMERLAFLAYFRLGRVHYFWNQLSQAKEYVTRALDHVDVNEYPAPSVRGYITLAWIQNAEGQYPQALQSLDQAERIALDQHQLGSVEMVRGVRAQLQLSAGENEAAARWAKSSDWGLLESSKSRLILSDESFFPYCQVLIASQNPQELKRGERLLEWRLKDSEAQRRDSTILKIRLMQALFHQTQKHAELAMTALLQALEIANAENVIRPFLDEGQLLFPLLRRVPQKYAVKNFAQKILASVSNSNLKPQPLLEPLSKQELNILKLMAQGHSNPAIARQLLLAVSTVRWYAKQIFRKLGVHNRTQASIEAQKLDLL